MKFSLCRLGRFSISWIRFLQKLVQAVRLVSMGFKAGLVERLKKHWVALKQSVLDKIEMELKLGVPCVGRPVKPGV